MTNLLVLECVLEQIAALECAAVAPEGEEALVALRVDEASVVDVFLGDSEGFGKLGR